MSRLTYADKVALNVNAGIPAQNKISDTDMNNLKKAVNQIGSFTTATVATGQPGKCYITMPGTLVAGDMFAINLPTSVNPSAVVQLSVDGGTNYYNIRFFDTTYNLLVRNVENQRIVLYFDGTYFRTLKNWVLVLYDKDVTNLQLGYSGGIQFNTTVAAGSVTRNGLPDLTGLQNKIFNYIIKYGNIAGENVVNSRKIDQPNGDTYWCVNFRNYTPAELWLPAFTIQPKTNGSWILNYDSSKVMTASNTVITDTLARNFFIIKMYVTN